ncbi:hypothetical protein K2X33_12215 [bacterium]|nr:hypothetical protein [bacterium]
MRRFSRVVLVVFGLLLGTTGSAQPPAEKPSEETVEAVATGIRDSGFKLFSTLYELSLLRAEAGGEQQLTISPMSIAEAMTLLSLGAEKQTLDELAALFIAPNSGIKDPAESLSLSVREIRSQLADFAKHSGDTFEYTSANAIIINTSSLEQVKLNADYRKKAAAYYDAQVFPYAFDQNALATVNNWVEEKTKGRVKKLIENLDSNTLSLLINATYTKGKFAKHFNRMSEGTYTTAKGKKVPAFFLTKNEEMGYAKSSGLEIFSFKVQANDSVPNVERDQIALDILVPSGASLEGTIAGLTGRRYAAFVKLLAPTDVELTIAAGKLEPQKAFQLGDVFQTPDYSVRRAFDSDLAEFDPLGRLSNGAAFHISEVRTKSFYEVTPFGFEAAAGTAIATARGGFMSNAAVKRTVDGPSIHVVRHIPTGTPLMISVYDFPKNYTEEELAKLVAEGSGSGRQLNVKTAKGYIHSTWHEGKRSVVLEDENRKVLKVFNTAN